MRLYGSSAEADPASLRPGEDLALRIELHHGTTVPQGSFAEDYLDAADRSRIDDVALNVMRRWCDLFEDPLTINGTPLPWIWEFEIFRSVFQPMVRDALV